MYSDTGVLDQDEGGLRHPLQGGLHQGRPSAGWQATASDLRCCYYAGKLIVVVLVVVLLRAYNYCEALQY